MNKYKIFLNNEIILENLTLLQATKVVRDLKKKYINCTIEIGK